VVPSPPQTSPPYLPPVTGSAGPRSAVPAEIRNYPPGPQPPAWRYPNEAGVRYLPPPPTAQAPAGVQAPPQQAAPQAPRSIVQLQAPQVDPGPATMPRVQEENRTAPPPASIPNPPTQSPMPPTGISQFAMARDQVASGLEPFDEGYSWLKQENFRTVLHLRAPGEDDSAAREKVTQRGMQFRSIEVSPETLTPAVFEQFARIVNDRDLLPLFVYDRDGIAAGALWRIYFQKVDKLSDAEARTKAGRLGYRNDEASKNMELAAQKLLNDQLK
jgi:protein tyrosine phosphatase (PTP) superfamily phosphohydrolase (DUF442 family)